MFLFGISRVTMTWSGLQMTLIIWKLILWRRQNEVAEDLKHSVPLFKICSSLAFTNLFSLEINTLSIC